MAIESFLKQSNTAKMDEIVWQFYCVVYNTKWQSRSNFHCIDLFVQPFNQLVIVFVVKSIDVTSLMIRSLSSRT